MKTLSKLLPAFLLLFLMVPGNARADEFSISSISGYMPGEPVVFNVTGTPGMSFNIRIIDSGQNIVGGRDAALSETGNYDYIWTPTQEGEYNVTVTWATGLSISKIFLIQYRVTSRDIGEIYQRLFGIDSSLKQLIAGLDWKANLSLALGVSSFIFGLGVVIWVRRTVSPAESAFEQLLREVAQSATVKEIARLRKLVEEKTK